MIAVANSPSFCTPVSFSELKDQETVGQKFFDFCEGYFWLTEREVAHVVPRLFVGDRYGVSFKEVKPELLNTILKVVSYLTVIMPLFVLISRSVLRASCSFQMVEREFSNGSTEFGYFDENKRLIRGMIGKNENLQLIDPKFISPEIQIGEYTFCFVDLPGAPVAVKKMTGAEDSWGIVPDETMKLVWCLFDRGYDIKPYIRPFVREFFERSSCFQDTKKLIKILQNDSSPNSLIRNSIQNDLIVIGQSLGIPEDQINPENIKRFLVALFGFLNE